MNVAAPSGVEDRYPPGRGLPYLTARRRRDHRLRRGESVMLEIEMKFPAADFDRLLASLDQHGARSEGEHAESDHYYNAPDRDFGRTDEALRLRRVGAENRITYKGPRHPGPTKTRTEIEVPLQPGDEPAKDFLRLVEHLGYRATAVVRKVRRAFALERAGFAVQVCLDDVGELGRFAEIEIVTP